MEAAHGLHERDALLGYMCIIGINGFMRSRRGGAA